jgi:methylamine dehydrogenase accessory protein MauD
MPTGIWLYSYLVLWALLLIESLLMIGIVRQIGSMHGHYVKNDPDSGLPLGALAPAIHGEDVYGRPVSLATSRGKKTLIYFLSTGCHGCRTVLSYVHALGTLDEFELILVMSASKMRTQLFLAELWHGSPTPSFMVVADEKRLHADRYKSVVVPYAVVVDEDGLIGAKGGPMTLTEVAALLRQADELMRRRHEEVVQEGVVSATVTSAVVASGDMVAESLVTEADAALA